MIRERVVTQFYVECNLCGAKACNLYGPGARFALSRDEALELAREAGYMKFRSYSHICPECEKDPDNRDIDVRVM